MYYSLKHVIARSFLTTKQSRWNLESAFLIETRLLLRQLADRNDVSTGNDVLCYGLMYNDDLRLGLIYFDIVISNQDTRVLNSDSVMIGMFDLMAERYLSDLDGSLQIK